MSRVIQINIPFEVFLPCYTHLLESKADINLLWGGRDSGKTQFIAQMLVMKCLMSKKFRCVLVRKTFNSIKDSQWQTIKDVCENWGVSHLFTFRESPLSIACVNGNGFICRGCDMTSNIKSIKDPTDCWYEEMNQLTLNDFIVVATTLRSNESVVQQWGSFNPEALGPYEEFWIYKVFFSDQKNVYSNFTSTWTITTPTTEVHFTYTSTWTTYKDNRYVTPQRIAFLEHMAVLTPHYYVVFTEGKWGNEKVNSPFCYCYNPEVHNKSTRLMKQLEVVLSFDFNVDPITCGVYQEQFGKIKGIESIQLPNSDIYKLCEYINATYRHCTFLVTGDSTGRNTTALVQDGINYYTVIREKLMLATSQIKVPMVNPKVSENRVLVNAALHTTGLCEFDPIKCKHLLYDFANVSVNDVGDIDKGSRTNPKKRADALDHFRYYLNTFHKNILRL